MTPNEIVQWSVVCLIILIALVWWVIKIVRLGKKKDGGGCSCCDQSTDCKAKDLKNRINVRQSENCHDGQSARN